MKIVNLKIVFLLLIFTFSIDGVSAQRVKATASLDSAKILLGDQVKLFLQLDKPKHITVSFPILGDTIVNYIEIIDRSGIDTFEGESDEFEKLIQSFTITCFDSGTYRIPPYWFNIEVEGVDDSIPSNGVTLQVFSMAIDTTRGPTDIKMPYDAPLSLKEVTPYILGVILLGAILFFILYSIKRKKNNQPLFSKPVKPKEPAHIVALRELDRIKSEKIWQKDKIKQYYSEVTEAIRVYIESRFEIPAMEQTSDETIEAFRVKKGLINDKHFSNLSQILKLADMVKFAKYKPLADDHNFTLVNAFFFVNETKIEEEKPGKLVEENDEEGEEVTLK